MTRSLLHLFQCKEKTEHIIEQKLILIRNQSCPSFDFMKNLSEIMAEFFNNHQKISMRIQQQIEEKLHYFFQPTHLEVINESHQHNVPTNSETHFKVILASEKFRNQRLIQQHQQVYQLLAEEMKGGVHALSLHTYSPEKWATQPAIANSPTCLGGGIKK